MKLIINADDFGLSNAVTYGIYDCIKRGVVTSTTQMMNTKATELASELIIKNPDLKVGLHTNISYGKPLTNCPSLIKDGYFIKPKDLLNDDNYDEKEIYLELKAQYNKFLKLNNKKPTHLDSHLYAHQKFEKVRKQLIKLSEEENIPIREYENIFYESVCFERGFRVLPGETLKEAKEKFIRLIEMNKDKKTVEIMVHPGYVDIDMLQFSSYNHQRIMEAAVLLDKEIKKYMSDNNIELVSYLNVEKKYGNY